MFILFIYFVGVGDMIKYFWLIIEYQNSYCIYSSFFVLPVVGLLLFRVTKEEKQPITADRNILNRYSFILHTNKLHVF